MSGSRANPRARANHELYLARIVLAAWRDGLAQQEVPARTLAQAFQGAVREHLMSGYGWFLLAVAGGAAPPAGLPRSCDDLLQAPPGEALPGEINEFRQLEATGWLADMLRAPPAESPEPRGQHNLATGAGNLPEQAQMARWTEQLDALFSRMDDSLDEY